MKRNSRFFRRKLTLTLSVFSSLAVIAGAEVEVLPDSSFSWDEIHGPIEPSGIVPDNLSTEDGATAFAIDTGHNPPHTIPGLNNGEYGNSNSWIGVESREIDVGDDIVESTFAGVDFAGTDLHNITSFAFGRSNLGDEFADRTQGTYYVQTTETPDPDVDTPDEEWSTLGGLEIFSNDFPNTYRHLYNLESAVPATGIRVVTPGPGTCIDEIEVYTSAPAGLRPAESGGEIESGNNLAARATSTAFAKDVLAGREISSLNDQTYGDASAWVGGTAESFAGISLGNAAIDVSSIAFSRDNTGTMTDRSLGEYTLQFTEVVDPDETTPDENWTTIGKILYEADNPAKSHERHRFNFGTKEATGIRLLTPDGAAIDELEVYENGYVPPPPPALTITPSAGFSATWDGNDGDFYDEDNAPALVPENAALATNGSTPFASNPTSPHSPPHDFAKLNDGFYGNSHSHINGAGPDPGFMGVALPDPIELAAVAWGRDNGTPGGDAPPGGEFDCCGGQLRDRTVGLYTLQFTIAANPDETTPDEDWTTIAEFNYTEGPDDEPGDLFTEYLRHQFEIGTDGGDSILATGVRIIVPNAGICIDEIELYGVIIEVPFEITSIEYNQAAAEVSFTWNSKVGVTYATEVSTDLVDWRELDDGVEGEEDGSTTFTETGVPPDALERYYRVRVLD
jgi:hypothetical protein